MNAAELKIDLVADDINVHTDGTGNDRAAKKKALRACHHCGSALTDATMRETGFCCSGCAYVYRLIHESRLDAYYRIKDPITAPVDSTVFQAQDADWLRELQDNAEQHSAENNQSSPNAKLGIQGISCAGCVWLIEKLFEQLPGARRITVNAQLGHMEISWTAGEFSLPAFAQKLASFNYLVGPHDATAAEPESRALVRRIGLCTAFVMNTMLFTLPTYFGMEADFPYARLFGTLSLAFGTLSMLAGGGYFVRRAWAGLRHGLLHIDLPISLGILGAYLGSLYGWAIGEEAYVYFDFVSTFIVLMLIGRWAQVCAVERNRRRLLSLQPRPQHILILQPDGTLRPTPPERLAPGQTLELRSGQILPVEAILETSENVSTASVLADEAPTWDEGSASKAVQRASSGASPEWERILSADKAANLTAGTARAAAREAEFSLASINGESAPRRFAVGQRVPAGALNLSRSPVRLRATQAWAHSLLAELTATQSEAEHRNPLLERIVQGYLIGILAVAALAGLFWGIHTGDLLKTGAIVTAILVVSCPCAIGLAFPLAEEIASVALRRRGVFVRNPRLWSLLHKVRKLVFDKTGTLTLETPVLQNPEALTTLGTLDTPAGTSSQRELANKTGLRPLPDEDRAALYTLIRDNPHPVSQCLLEALLASGPTPEPLEGEVLEEIGCGVSLGPWSLGKADWKTNAPDGTRKGTVFAYDGKPVATFHLSDSIRSDAREEIAKLRALGLDAHILSGDATHKVQSTAAQLGLPYTHGHGQMSPQEKANWLRAHAATDALMLGDGLNDSLAFDAALLRGTPVIHRGTLAQKADFYYLGRGIGGIRALFEVNAIRRRAERVILIFSVSYNLLAVGFAAAGFINPLIAAILMPINSLLTLALVSASMRSLRLF